jgi:hypothetical protein
MFKSDNGFSLDELKETASPDSQSETAKDTDTEDSEDSSSPVGNEETEQKVPYSRFKKKVDEVHEYSNRIKMLEESLEQLKTTRISQNDSEAELPKEWVELHGDSAESRRFYEIQTQREALIEERAIEKAIERIERKQTEAVERLSQNEQIIDENLENLSETLGVQLTTKEEDEILGIVDELSPTGEDGKYLAMISFEKAYEIYQMRNNLKTQKTQDSRKKVASLTNDNSNGNADDSTNTSIGNSWDSWRNAL